MNKKLYLRQLIRQYKPFIILSFFLTLAEPLVLLTQKQSILNQAQALISRGGTDLFQIYHSLYYLAAIACFLAVLIPFIVFNFLYKKADLDNYYSMPVKRKDLFQAHFWFGWSLLIALPLLIAALCRYGILYSYLHPYVRALSGGPTFLLRILILVLGSLVLYLLTLLALFCTTNIFNGLIYTGAVHSFFPFLAFLIETISKSRVGFLYGAETESLRFYDFISFIGSYMTYLTSNGAYTLPVILFWFVLGVPFFFLIQKLFEERRAERVNGAYMFRKFYPAVIGIYGTTFLTKLLTDAFMAKINSVESVHDYAFDQTSMTTSILQIFLLGLIVYFIVQLVRYHGKPPVLQKLGIYLILFALSTSFAFGLTGPVRRKLSLSQPALSKVKWVKIRNIVEEESSFLYYLEHPEEYEPENFKYDYLMKDVYKLGPNDKDPRPKPMKKYTLPSRHPGAPVPSDEVGQTHTYEEALYSAEDAKKIIMDLHKETVEKILKGEKKEFLIEVPCPPDEKDDYNVPRSYNGAAIRDYSPRGDGKCYSSRWPSVQFIYLDKDKKVLMERELPIFKADRQKVQQLLNEKLFYTDGVLVKAGDR